MKKRSSRAAAAVTVIGGSDGPTSIFLAGKFGGRKGNPLRRFRDQWRGRRMQKRRARVMGALCPKPHTPDELVRYIRRKYHATELAPDSRRAKEGYRSHKCAIAWKEQKDRLEQMGYVSPEKKSPANFSDRAAVEEWHRYMREYDAAAAGLDDSLVPMDYHIYQIRLAHGGKLEVEMEKIRGMLGVGFCAPKREIKQMKKIRRDIYLYYGVTKEDIENSTDRYLTLVTMLAD